MAISTSLLAVTTSTLEGIKIIRYIKPVSAHIVTGINVFGDFLGSITDTFGGRSNTYQKQLESIYNEAIEKLKRNAFEIGGNCIVGLKVDVSEISGKGKSMLMITAVGTAVEIEKLAYSTAKQLNSIRKTHTIDLESIKILREKEYVREQIRKGALRLNEVTWNFITENQMYDVYPFLIKTFSELFNKAEIDRKLVEEYREKLIRFIDGQPDDIKLNLIYSSVENENNNKVLPWITKIIERLNLFDYEKILLLLSAKDFEVKKRAIKIATIDKPFYNQQDKKELEALKIKIEETFTEKVTRSTKKQLLSSKEKEVWICECGKTMDSENLYCSGCGRDTYGFLSDELKPSDAILLLEEKIRFISEYID